MIVKIVKKKKAPAKGHFFDRKRTSGIVPLPAPVSTNPTVG